MGIVRMMRVFFSLDRKTMFLFIEAFFYLGWARYLVYLPFSKVAPSLGVQLQETSHTEIPEHKTTLKSVNQAIYMMSNHTPWESKCFVKAIAGMKMLERRKIESTLYLGTAKNGAGKMIAHAWLRSGPFYITGAGEMVRFTVVSKFARQISGRQKKGN